MVLKCAVRLCLAAAALTLTNPSSRTSRSSVASQTAKTPDYHHYHHLSTTSIDTPSVFFSRFPQNTNDMVSRRPLFCQLRTDAHTKDRWLLVHAHATKEAHRSASVQWDLQQSCALSSGRAMLPRTMAQTSSVDACSTCCILLDISSIHSN